MKSSSSAFVFERYSFDKATGILRMAYAFEGGETFEETIQFPPIGRTFSAADDRALGHAFRLIFLLAGVSYYKAFVPPNMMVKPFALDTETAQFVGDVYQQGLGEFAFRNQIDLGDRINFKPSDTAVSAAGALSLSSHYLVPVGGGKDSIVTIEMLRRAGKPITLFALSSTHEPAAPIRDTIATAKIPALVVERHLSPNLSKLNDAGALNGHVPITAILSAIAVAVAIMQGMGFVVLSNERSADAPNLVWKGQPVNHQYSKSFAFERAFSDYVKKHIAADLHYFSLLRPFGEAAITARFARLENYHHVFRSCNTAFRQDASKRGTHWCCDCPKCRFVFLALAPFMDKGKLTAIFGKNMLDDMTQEQGFAELCGLSAYKPFECVGEVEESAALLAKLAADPAWKDDGLVEKLAQQLPQRDWNAAFAAMLAVAGEHQIPPDLLGALNEAL